MQYYNTVMLFTLEMMVEVLITVISLSNNISKHSFFLRCYFCCSALVPEVYYALVKLRGFNQILELAKNSMIQLYTHVKLFMHTCCI